MRFSSADNRHLTLIGGRQKAAGAIHCFNERHRNVGDRLQARRLDFTIDINPLAAIRLHAQCDIRISDITRQLAREEMARLRFGQAGDFQCAGERELDDALMVDDKAGWRRCGDRISDPTTPAGGTPITAPASSGWSHTTMERMSPP